MLGLQTVAYTLETPSTAIRRSSRTRRKSILSPCAKAYEWRFQEVDRGGIESVTDATTIRGNLAHADTGFGHEPILDAELDPSQGNTRILIHFPFVFGTGSGQIAAGDEIESATLTLTTSPRGNDGSLAVHFAHRALTPWDEETVTWNAFHAGGVAGVDYEEQAFAEFVPLEPDEEYDIDVTEVVRSWGEAPDESFGLIVINPEIDRSTFVSNEGSPWHARPLLTVVTPAPEPSRAVHALTSLCALASIAGRSARSQRSKRMRRPTV